MTYSSQLDILRELREQVGLTQDDMARICGLQGQQRRQTAGAWERGDMIPSRARRNKFIGYLWDDLRLRTDSARFETVWEILMMAWGWEPISDKEWGAFTTQARPARPDRLDQKVEELENALHQLQSGAADLTTNPTSLILPPQPSQPPTSATFVGRQQELTDFNQRLASEGLVVITGMAGVGKTTVAAVLARAGQYNGCHLLAYFS